MPKKSKGKRQRIERHHEAPYVNRRDLIWPDAQEDFPPAEPIQWITLDMGEEEPFSHSL